MINAVHAALIYLLSVVNAEQKTLATKKSVKTAVLNFIVKNANADRKR